MKIPFGPDTRSFTQLLIQRIGIFLLYGDFAPEEKLDPILGIGSITVLSAAVLMFYMVLKAKAVKA